MEKVLLVMLGLLAAAVAVLVILLRSQKAKRQKAEAELATEKTRLKETETKLEKQKEIVRIFEDALSTGSKDQQEISEKEKKLITAGKGAQTSEAPVKKSISVGNDIIGSFNSAGKLSDK